MAREMRPDKRPSPQFHTVSLDGSKARLSIRTTDLIGRSKPELLNAGHLVRLEPSTASCDDYMCRYRIIRTRMFHASELERRCHIRSDSASHSMHSRNKRITQ
ncbi:hypothetical protein BKA82DRAFT_1003225 [Pisolithus tinctorius]|uniref:Uncharacterized protein n=1 Tax=Pisolithus tinctorius Marx 270 TaxID=870435 RepID=A0A0C3P1W0_PISTI|nr:hypothetical protein BKA82DRAFT_1003225 [Pisolithus tinctorius]KIO01304.1 hypothetical protein M404DRAFT_1003225 [Pisolithus tinctorius Marx 270]